MLLVEMIAMFLLTCVNKIRGLYLTGTWMRDSATSRAFVGVQGRQGGIVAQQLALIESVKNALQWACDKLC